MWGILLRFMGLGDGDCESLRFEVAGESESRADKYIVWVLITT
jgi:hypothetical protein